MSGYVLAGYGATLGSLAAYSVHLLRRLRAGRDAAPGAGGAGTDLDAGAGQARP